jgi:outer membrane lipoprotein-sorting protein
MKNIPKLTPIYLVILVFFTASLAMAASFSADIVMEKNGKTETGKIYFLNQYYRLEVPEDGKPIVIIADREKNVHRFLNMEEKVFFEIPSDDFRILTSDPFKASEYMVSNYGSQVEGNEKINGFNCERQAVMVQDTKIHSRWFSKKLKIPVKLVSYDGKKASYVTELKNIREVDLQKELFVPPSGFKQVEEPGAAEERKREKLRKAEEALPGLTAVRTTQVPCYTKIAGGGELCVQMDTDRRAYLEITNQVKGESEIIILPYCNGKPSECRYETTWKLKGKGDRSSFDFNDDFAQRAESYLVDEVRIKATKGLVYALLRQSGEDRKDSYNSGGQTDHGVDPKRALTVRITGDNPFGDKTTGKFLLRYGQERKSESIPFTLTTGETQTWEYPADKGVQEVIAIISKGDGRAKISLIQPPVLKKAAPEQSTVKKTPKPTYTPKAKAVTQFTVTHPYGTGKPLTPGKDLTVTVTGISGDASGDIILYSDRKKTKKIDAFNFKLKKNQAKSFGVSGEKDVGWATVWVHKGSFKVKLDQSPNAKAAPAPKTNKESVAPVAAAVPTTSNGTILNGRVPLMKGARVLKSKIYGTSGSVQMEVSATPEEIVNYYKQAMTAKGWQPVLAMAQGNVGVLQLKIGGRQMVFKAEGQGQMSKVSMVLMGQ